jgi:hypothetical protein
MELTSPEIDIVYDALRYLILDLRQAGLDETEERALLYRIQEERDGSKGD